MLIRLMPFRTRKILLLGLLMWVQVTSSSHATLFGDGPHEHDGIQCELALVSSHQVAIEPDLPKLPDHWPASEITPDTAFFGPVWTRPPGRAPPPRGPPSSKQ